MDKILQHAFPDKLTLKKIAELATEDSTKRRLYLDAFWRACESGALSYEGTLYTEKKVLVNRPTVVSKWACPNPTAQEPPVYKAVRQKNYLLEITREAFQEYLQAIGSEPPETLIHWVSPVEGKERKLDHRTEEIREDKDKIMELRKQGKGPKAISKALEGKYNEDQIKYQLRKLEKKPTDK